ncbi:hypothetical protein Mucpa_1171 [Mucilaginibacter paludis DSM 18603]|uniref:Uncharacterized protein n=1 Tax=Mucilaginibacter paludis DSM 18603 TaxID=714943 RepID=H1YFU6_9SPHI|nr:hypothetical protein Mucpa_1171 [Mucilaginibacter paludis DSM 18603]
MYKDNKAASIWFENNDALYQIIYNKLPLLSKFIFS